MSYQVNSMKHPIFVSESDLEAEAIRLVIERVGIESVLYMIGFDNSVKVLPDALVGDGEEFEFEDNDINPDDYTFYQVDYVEHINRSGKRVKCNRYCGFERMDSEWLNGGNASEMAILLSKNDPSLLSELKSLGG